MAISKLSGSPVKISLLALGCASLTLVTISPRLYAQDQGDTPAVAPAAPAPSTEDKLKKATDAFNSGDYATAASILGEMVSHATDTSKLEPIFYMLGAANYNVPNYSDAATAFKKYMDTYPKGDHINDVTLALARSLVNLKRPDEALPLLKTLEDNPSYREKVLFLEANIGRDGGNVTAAIAALEKIVLPQIKDATAANAGVILAQLYLKNGDTAKASDLLAQLEKNITKVNNIFSINSLAISLGDSYLRQNEYDQAIASYRSVHPKQQILDLVSQRIEDSQNLLLKNRETARTNPAIAQQLMFDNIDVQTSIDDDKAKLVKYKDVPDFTAAIWLRLGQTYYRLQRKWEALVVFNELLDTMPDAKEREFALLGKIIDLADLNMTPQALDCCADFIKNYQQSTQLPLVTYLQGALAFQSKDYATAETNLAKYIPLQKEDRFRDEMEFLLASAQFAQGKYDKSIENYQKYQRDFSRGKHYEESWYRIGLATLLNGYPVKAYSCFQDYISKFPNGTYAPDCAYRSAYCRFSDQKYDEVINLCNKWFIDYPANPQSGEVEALIGDANVALQKPDEALAAYMKAVSEPASDQNLGYSLKAANKLLEKKGDWATVSTMWENYVKLHPNDLLVMDAMLAISKAKTHEGKIQEAKDFLVATIKPNASDPAKDGVEPLLSQLAKICARSRAMELNKILLAAAAAAPAPTPGTPGAPDSTVPAPAPPDPALDPKDSAEIQSLLQPLEAMGNPTAHARFLYARSQYALARKNFAEQESCIKQIADGFKPGDLSATLLGLAGDYCLNQKRWDNANAFFQELIVAYPRSDVADFGYVGLGDIALGKKDFPAALKDFNDAMDKVTGDTKIKDAITGKAQALLGLNQLDEAQKLFEQVAGNRAWRGESTALSVYCLGMIQEQQSKWPEAIAYYQRVYVAYQRYTSIVAKAYIHSAECFKKLNKNQEAINTYKEMLQNPRLAGLPEIQQAKDHLKELGAAG